MARKPGLTLQEHIVLGAELAALRDAVQTRFIAVSRAYPHAAKQVRELKKAADALDTARTALDNALAQEDPDGFGPHVYYPDDDRPMVAFQRPHRRR